MTLLLAVRGGWDEAAWMDRFQRLMPEMPVVSDRTAYDAAAVKYVACWKHEPGSLATLPNVKTLFSLGAGVDHLVTDRSLPGAPIVRMVNRDLTERMTEWVVWQCLDWLRQGDMYRRQKAEKRWHDDRQQPGARDVRVGVMGLGVLGCDALDKLKRLRFDVAGWSRSAKSIPDVPTFHGEDGLTDFLQRTDILVVLLPLTDDTRGFLNRSVFKRLQKDGRLGGPVLVNAGRGGLQIETDILAALDAGDLLGATLDVFETEPLPVASPLWTHPRVMITPHNSAMSEPDAIAREIIDHIRNNEAGRPLVNLVDRTRGY